MGLNFVFRTRSGEPYTRIALPNSTQVVGSAMGSRLPWHYMMDVRVDKEFNLPFAKHLTANGTSVSKYSLTGFIYVTNLLNTKDVLGVYGFTGRPDDDGFLTTAQGIQEASIKVSPTSYKDLYSLSNQYPGFINNPRRINIGFQFNF
jgi:hypothetical protein